MAEIYSFSPVFAFSYRTVSVLSLTAAVLAVNPSDADDIIIAAGECGDKAVKLGAVVKGKEVIL